MDWIKVENNEKLLEELDDGTYIFLIQVYTSVLKTTYWQIVAGYIDDSGEIYSQHDDNGIGWEYTDIYYYKPIGALPPLEK